MQQDSVPEEIVVRGWGRALIFLILIISAMVLAFLVLMIAFGVDLLWSNVIRGWLIFAASDIVGLMVGGISPPGGWCCEEISCAFSAGFHAIPGRSLK